MAWPGVGALFGLVVGLLGGGAAVGSPYIDVHVSVKVIRNPANGSAPPIDDAGTIPITASVLTRMIGHANELFASYWRGYRYVLDPVSFIGSPCSPCTDPSNPSWWYHEGFPDSTAPGPALTFESHAMHDAAFLWDPGAVNVYVNWGRGDGAFGSFPPPDTRSNYIVVVGSRCFLPTNAPEWSAMLFTHETGHFFGLNHPNGSVMPCCTPATCIKDGDLIADTMPDGPCFKRDTLVQFNFNGLHYGDLDAAQREVADNTYWNNMGYIHPDQTFGSTLLNRRSEGQLDAWTDVADAVRAPVTRGRTWFVAGNGSDSGSGSSTSPFLTVSRGVTAAMQFHPLGGDVVLLRPGAYFGTLVIDTPVTLRIARPGSAVVGN